MGYFIYFSGSLTFALGVHFFSTKLQDLKEGKKIAFLFIITLVFEFMNIYVYSYFAFLGTKFNDKVSAIVFINQHELLIYSFCVFTIFCGLLVLITSFLINNWLLKVFKNFNKKFHYYFYYGVLTFFGLVILSISFFVFVTRVLYFNISTDSISFQVLSSLRSLVALLLFVGIIVKIYALSKYYQLVNKGMNQIREQREVLANKTLTQ